MLRLAKSIAERFLEWLHPSPSSGLPTITEASTLSEVAELHPHAFAFLEKKYGLRPGDAEKRLSLRRFAQKHGMPSAQILFMEIQMAARTPVVELSPRDAKALIDSRPEALVLDVRETWETGVCRLPRSRPLSPQLLDELLSSPERGTPLLFYCHFGVRSLDAASFLADRGFREVYTLAGGIDAWSVEIDPTVKRYEGHYC